MEVVFDYQLVEGLLHSERNVLRTLVLEREVKEAYRPVGIAIVDRHQILLELLHRLGQEFGSGLVPLRFPLCRLVVLCQAVVQLEIADELESWKEMRLVEVGGGELSLEHFHDDHPLFFPQSLDLFD